MQFKRKVPGEQKGLFLFRKDDPRQKRRQYRDSTQAHEQHEISADQIKAMINLGCPGKKIIATEIIAGGCAIP